MKNLLLQKSFKRLFDISVSLVMILLLSWLYILVFIYHKLILRCHSDLLFIQPRVGRNNKVFHCIKFRTMSNFNRFYHSTPEIVRYEAFLRKYRVDEITQFFNVLKGDMSIVGPRPLVENEISDYSRTITNTSDRHNMKPGITGLSQISVSEKNGKSESLIMRKINQDIWYCNHWSLALDFKIFLKTPIFILSQKQVKFESIHIGYELNMAS